MSDAQPLPPPVKPTPNLAIDPAWKRMRRRYLFSPSRWIGGPVFTKEVWVLGKRMSTSWVRFVYGGLMVLLLVLVLTQVWIDRYGGGLQTLQAYQRIAPSITLAVLGFQFAMLPLMACVLGGGAVCEEVRAGSLGTLLSTPLRTWQIVMGKLLGRCTELLILALIALPLLLMLRVLGGVSGAAIIGPTAIAAVNALLALQISIWMSVRMKYAASAMGAAIAFMAMIWVTTGVVVFLFIEAAPWLQKYVPVQVVAATSAPVCMMAQAARFMGGGGLPFAAGHWLWHVLFTLTLTAFFFFLTTISLRRVMIATAVHGPGAGRTNKRKAKNEPRRGVNVDNQPEQPAAPDQAALDQATPDEASTQLLPGTIAADALPGKRKRRKSTVVEGFSRTVGDSPVLWREFQQRMTRGQWTFPVALGASICGSLFIYWAAGLEQGTQVSLALIGAVILMVLAALQTTAAISSEREGRTLEVLLTTPLTARAIVWGKLLGAAKRLSPVFIFIVVHLFFSGIVPHLTRYIFYPLDALARFMYTMSPTLYDRIGAPKHIMSWRGEYGYWQPAYVSPLAITIVLVVLACTIFLQLAVGLLLSCVMKRSTPAAITNLLFALLLWAFLPIGFAILDNDLVRGYFAFHPVVIMFTALEEGTNKELLTQTFEFPTYQTTFATFFSNTAIYCIVVVSLALAALKLAALELAFAGGRRR